MVMDTSVSEEANALVDLALSEYGRLDILVNNAGIDAPLGHAWDLPDDEWQRTIDVNLSGVFYLLQGGAGPDAGGRKRQHREHQLSVRKGCRWQGRFPSIQRQQGGAHRAYRRLLRSGGAQGCEGERHHAGARRIEGLWLVSGGKSCAGATVPPWSGKAKIRWRSRPLPRQSALSMGIRDRAPRYGRIPEEWPLAIALGEGICTLGRITVRIWNNIPSLKNTSRRAPRRASWSPKSQTGRWWSSSSPAATTA